MRSEVAQAMSLDQVRYTQVWEDHLLLEAGLDIGPDDDVLSICSAGCNVLALLLQEPRSITAIDMSPAQAAVLELKLAAIGQLSHGEFVDLLGVRAGLDRKALYGRIREALPPAARSFWDNHLPVLESSLLNAGRLDAYFGVFRSDHLPRAWPPGLARRLLEAPTIEAQGQIFFQEADTPRFKELFSWYYGREMMEAHGRDPAQFRHVEKGDVAAYFHKRLIHVMTELKVRGNFYLEAFFTGAYKDLRQAHPYLHPDNFEKLRALSGRVTVVIDELERFLMALPPGRFSKANLSDIFEYMSAGLAEQVFKTLAERFRRGGRLAYWNLLVPRHRPESLAWALKPLRSLSRDLWRGDRSWFYRDFCIDEVL